MIKQIRKIVILHLINDGFTLKEHFFWVGGEGRETFTHIFNTTHHLPVFLYCGTEQNCPVYKYKNPKEWTSIGAIWKGLTSTY